MFPVPDFPQKRTSSSAVHTHQAQQSSRISKTTVLMEKGFPVVKHPVLHGATLTLPLQCGITIQVVTLLEIFHKEGGGGGKSAQQSYFESFLWSFPHVNVLHVSFISEPVFNFIQRRAQRKAFLWNNDYPLA